MRNFHKLLQRLHRILRCSRQLPQNLRKKQHKKHLPNSPTMHKLQLEKPLDKFQQILLEEIKALSLKNCPYKLGSTVEILGEKNAPTLELLHKLKPWRKGPFDIFGTFIDTEWNSDIKYSIIENFLNINEKTVIDIGANNGYYLFRMSQKNPKSLTGIDPNGHSFLQFFLLRKLLGIDVDFWRLGVEDLSVLGKFDTAIFLGVLYHRKDPIGALKNIFNALNKGGELILDSLIIDSQKPICLCPTSYAKMTNVHFIPSIKTLQNWLLKTGFKEIVHIKTIKTTTQEQRKTEWINSQSLDNFLDPNNQNKTIEGHDAPIRHYIKAIKK